MKIAVIGAGFTGLRAIYELTKQGYKTSVFEKESMPGGLAVGFKENGWDWSLEKHYHHWFTNDNNILNLANEINFPVITRRPKTSIYVNEGIYPLDSPIHVLTFPHISFFDRLRMAGILGFLRYNPYWKMLEGIKTNRFLEKTMGKNAYKKIWEPQLQNKFGEYANGIALSWFWARIKKRTASLSYPKGGFLDFAQTIVKECEKRNGEFFFNTEVLEIKNNKNGAEVKFKIGNSKTETENYDAVIVTLPSFLFAKIATGLPENYKRNLLKLKGLGAINLLLRLEKQFLKDGTYWLSICEKKAPIMAVVEHTNFMDKKYYNDEHIVYLGNYLPPDHPYMKMSAEDLLKIYDPFLKKINPSYALSTIGYSLFKAPFAQPIIPIHYSKIIPSFKTPLKNIYLANIQQVYPWDRGTNYAAELGQRVAELIIKEY